MCTTQHLFCHKYIHTYIHAKMSMVWSVLNSGWSGLQRKQSYKQAPRPQHAMQPNEVHVESAVRELTGGRVFWAGSYE